MATTAPDRILSLDVIRGIAVMGIFSVNVVGMAMITSAYFYPPTFGFDSLGDRIMWAANSVLVDGRFRSMFSILFGASLIVVVQSAVTAGRAGWKVHYPRMIVLLLFGLAHYYFLWWGDILANYGLVGMIAFIFWRLKPKWLLTLAVLALLITNGKDLAGFIPMKAKVEHGMSAEATPEERAKVMKMISPPEDLDEQIAEDKQDHASIPAHFASMTDNPRALWRPFMSVPNYGLETLGLMLLGMAAFKSGFLTGAWRRKRYVQIAAICIGLDLTIQVIAAWKAWAADFAPLTFYPWVQMYVNPFHAIGAVGYIALIILLFPSRSALSDRFAAVGRAAFTNYLGSTIIGTLIFFGTFGGLYGEVSRGEAWLIVPPVWALMLLWSKWWLDRYRYGPFEWLWRSMSRMQIQPMRKSIPVEAEAIA